MLVLLSGDKDEKSRNSAFKTLQNWDEQELQKVLANPSTPAGVLDFVANHLAPGRKVLTQALLDNTALLPDLRDWVQNLLSIPEDVAGPPTSETAPTPVAQAGGKAGQEKKGERVTLIQKIGRMSVAEKIKAALTGSQEERLVLIRDSNKIVARAVLQSPKISDQESENIASMKNVTEEVLRLVATNRKFMKSYSVVRQLINNPRTPIDVGLTLLNRLNDRDIKGLTQNKNVAETLRTMANKMIRQKEEAQKPKLPPKH